MDLKTHEVICNNAIPKYIVFEVIHATFTAKIVTNLDFIQQSTKSKGNGFPDNV